MKNLQKGVFLFMNKNIFNNKFRQEIDGSVFNIFGTIVIEKRISKVTKAPSLVTFGFAKNRSTTGFINGGHWLPYGGVPCMPPLSSPPYFLDTKQFFVGDGLLKYYISNNITPPFVGDDCSISEKNWKYFKDLFEYNQSFSNRYYINRTIKPDVDVRDYIKRYINKQSLTLGFDTEWSGDERSALSYQFSTTVDGSDYDIVFYPDHNFSERLKLGHMLYFIVNYLFVGRGFVVKHEGKEHHKNPSYKTCQILLVAHFGGVDFSMLSDYQELLSYLDYSESQKSQMRHIEKIVKTGRNPKTNKNLLQSDLDILAERYKKIKDNPEHSYNLIVSDKHCMYTRSPRIYNFWYRPRKARCMFNIDIRDTMKLAPPGSPLASLGQSLGISKLDTLELDKADNKPVNHYKSHMDELLQNHPQFFHDYAVRDARISYEWYKMVVSIIGDGLTVSSISAKHLQKNIREAMESYYKNGVSWSNDVVGFDIEDHKPNYNSVSHTRGLFGDMPDYAYMGGRNESFTHGLITGRTYDYDLRSAYPFQMQCMRMIDFDKPPIVFNKGHELSLNDWKHFGQAGFGYVKFEFPENVKYPTIPLKSTKTGLEGTPVFLRTGEGLVSAPDVFAALHVGAKVTVAKQGFMFFDLKRSSEHDHGSFDDIDVDNDFIMHHVGFGVRNMIKIRAKYAKQYGKKSVQAQLMKILVNSTYGKTGQGIHGNTARNILNNETEVIPFSRITDGVIASTTTALVRSVLGLIMNYIDRQGYTVHSVTTDGFISDFPWERMLEIDEYLSGISTVFQKVIKACWGETLDWSTGKGSILEVKHIQDEFFFNVKTRGNISLDVGKPYTNPYTSNVENYDGVFAKAGYKGDNDFKYLTDYDKRFKLLNQIVNRNGALIDYQTDMLSFREVKQSNLKSITKAYDSKEDLEKRLSMDFDKKRMLLPREFSNIKTDVFKSDYGWFPTRPFENMEEYEYNAGIHKLFIGKDHCIKDDLTFTAYQYALNNGFPKYKRVNEKKLTSDELVEHQQIAKKYDIKQYLVYLLKFPELHPEDDFLRDVEDFSRKDYLDLILKLDGVDALETWKSIKKRTKHTFDLLTALEYDKRLKRFYFNTYYYVLSEESY